MISMTTHSLLIAPSSGYKRLNCSGSGYAELEMPNLFSYPAEEGTGAHEHCQACFNLKVPATFFLGKVFNDIVVTREQCVHVQFYLDTINDYGRGVQYLHYVEHRITLPEISEHLFGSCDNAIFLHHNGFLYVDDFKYGFDNVEVEGNVQLWIYALAMLSLRDRAMYRLLMALGFKVKGIQISIIQPRTMNGETYKTQLITPYDLESWGIQVLKPAMIAALDPHASRTAGVHCKHCKAKITCPEYLKWCNGVIEPPFQLTVDTIRNYMELEPSAKKLFEQAKQYGTEKLQRGFTVAGCKLVKTNKHRKLSNDEECATALLAGGATEEDVYTKKVKTPSQLEKSVGKVLKATVEAYTFKPEGSPVIALISDNRVAVATSKELFKNG